MGEENFYFLSFAEVLLFFELTFLFKSRQENSYLALIHVTELTESYGERRWTFHAIQSSVHSHSVKDKVAVFPTKNN